MDVVVAIDQETVDRFAKHGQDVARVVKEFALVELYRQGSISQARIGTELEFGQLDVHEMLIAHNVRERGPTVEEHMEGVARSMKWSKENPKT
jgi:hypothetical protein